MTKKYMLTEELPQCPVETTLLLISNKWTVLIVRDLLEGTKRFGELKKSVGSISQKVLTANLRAMEKNGLVIRTVFPEVPPHTEYTLTELGHSLETVLDALDRWGTDYQRGVQKQLAS
ncbi:helix-turn-helix domain-containing protein [Alloscardovia omnicolens]